MRGREACVLCEREGEREVCCVREGEEGCLCFFACMQV